MFFCENLLKSVSITSVLTCFEVFGGVDWDAKLQARVKSRFQGHETTNTTKKQKKQRRQKKYDMFVIVCYCLFVSYKTHKQTNK